ncbi:hypothetical protein KF946_12475 [Idiomarina loihiensis]|uniref:hypothetical protein n=1 Tax=Idiomarina loihiensis TaxID=135577 RepID=UPI00129CC93C|nr:hypothetical protein [Idiomarina loihiensis]MRJ45751.1 hypothetical protein [Idiomarina loihiensis]UTW32808.1 hypothetical protein KF946_12475 [Idiomarina loihiensis]
MRYIDPDLIDQCKPDKWDVNARDWNQRVVNSNNKSAEIKAIGSKWSAFKPNFIEKFGDKCWYSEVPRIGTDFDVDHFRPKGSVKIDKTNYATRTFTGVSVIQQHPGYWWLAFDARNYRYSCIEANRPRGEGGKHDYFPLTDEITRIWNKGPIANCSTEKNTLLDPCSKDDVKLLSYDKTLGAVESRYAQTTHPIECLRVNESRDRYNLNSKTVKDARTEVINDVIDALSVLENTWYLPLEYKNQERALTSVARMEEKLVRACNRKSKFSAAAVAYVLPKKAEPWLANILPHLDLKP